MDKSHPQYDTFKDILLEHIRGRKYEPLTEKAFFKKLNIDPKFHALCHMILKDLQEEGILEIKNKKFNLSSREAKELMTGTLHAHAKGFGFVTPDHPLHFPQDIFIPKHQMDNAVDGDRVEVEILSSQSPKGPEGKIIAILERGRTHIGATIHHIGPPPYAFAYSPLLGTTKFIRVKPKKKTKVGDRVIIKVKDWGDEDEGPVGEISHSIGNISDPSTDIEAAVEEFDLRGIFPPGVLEMAKEWGTEVPKPELKQRVDLTDLTTCTIDPETAKDFDDAISIARDKKGGFRLGVHIADVSHYVPVGSALDKEAIMRGNSTYFPGYVIPMIPHELSDRLCSLQPNVIRLTISVIMDFDKEGNLKKKKIVRGFIKSSKRFSYEEAKEVLEGKIESPFLPMLQMMVELCHLLKNKRSERGSIDFGLPDLVIVVDDKGMPKRMQRVEYDITHQMIEEFMLKANEVVATDLSNRGKPVIYRIHESPDQEDMEEFFKLARSLGFSLPPKPTQRDLQELFEKAKISPHAQQLSVAFIRSMKLAYYSPENVGHFGLALEYYCHFTSPIRRYTDLVIQRLLFDEEGKDLEIEKISEICSEKERLSWRAENSVKILKKLRLMDQWMKDDPQTVYEAVVTRVKPFGLFFEINHLMLEGFLHISELENDYFVHNPEQNILSGRGTGKTHYVGEKIEVRPLRIDLILLESHWELSLPRKERRRRK